ncbi:hypothetical protein FEK33_07755 [Nocardia asteroides NBRC 15531]|uniref:Uncharacterized protein n=1 Tax=Nocardia asteroides NBRC 15531 TaxID=1110697 RepID=U5ECT2_NOCAS|nr:hypothetical protein [Nocardia asteroides]TLF70117.1 hypothetical protein FEK33_07755 [Nocardia asteroides NBRC 15531]UGT49643.1 hypothetical protein LT345_03245 [Nocardia asteroides]SFL97083.1 hypothetical protein SAMN05444423_1011576 [Nocardia asteroides]VEG37666.1 Uncharacterised protein [Nocardia asteroides]GAD84258.1 hypothetical protein NCAST_23_00160 [Nocardia asteroides NBRC 15531]
MSGRNGFLLLGGISSVGAGAVHFMAAGMHTEHATLARSMVVLAAIQCATGLAVLLSERRIVASAVLAVNAFAAAIWAFTRFADIPWITGLTAESPQVADTVCAALGALAAVAVGIGLLRPQATLPPLRSGVAAAAVGVLALAAMLNGVGHVHSHGETGDHAHAAGEDHGDHHDTGSAWPRPFDPTQPIDLSGVPGVTADQQQRATNLIRSTLDGLPAFADVSTVGALGFRSIGDAATGYEHYINTGYIRDGNFLDATHPESLVYRVDGANRTLVSAMYIANGKKIDDPALTDFGGSLMQWHVHDNLCWKAGDNGPVVAGVTDAQGNCPPNSINPGSGNPMVHVWIAPHECGPFAALEGHGAGQASATDGRRTDTCGGHDHGGGHK